LLPFIRITALSVFEPKPASVRGADQWSSPSLL
jgi:hypothetical protein